MLTGSPHHSRQRSAEKGVPLPLSMTSTGIGPLTTFGNSVAAGSSIPGPPTSTVARLARRDPGSTNSEVRWNELLEKFKSTQERARRRNERAMRGEDDDFDNELTRKHSNAKTLDGASEPPGGRRSRASGRQSAEIRRPGSGLSTDRVATGLGIRPPGTGPGTGQSTTRGPNLRQDRAPDGGQADSDAKPGHRSKHSLIGKFGIRSGSRDKDGTGSGSGPNNKDSRYTGTTGSALRR